MRTNRIDLLLSIGLAAIFTFLSITASDIIRGWRDVVWLLVGIIGSGIYALTDGRQVGMGLLISLVKLELIFMIAELSGFAVYVVESKAIQHRDMVAWLFFYPYLIWTALIVLCVYPGCEWVFGKLFRWGI